MKLSLKERYSKVIEYFSKTNPGAETELHYASPYQLLVAVILSAQCTDKRVNLVTPKLFEVFPTPYVLANSSSDEVYKYIKSISYPYNKAKHLVGMAKILVEKFNNVVPSSPKDLESMPGVGRKTANVIASVVYNKPRMAVDTHVFRVANRIGLTSNSKTPLSTEKKLVRYIPIEKIALAHHWLILHGRYICKARKPNCAICELKEFCTYFEKNKDYLSSKN
jgi:endonuclease-3